MAMITEEPEEEDKAALVDIEPAVR